MKKILFFVLALSLPLVFTSCSDDGDQKKEKLDDTTLSGVWTLAKVVSYDVKTNSAENDKLTLNYVKTETEDWDFSYEFLPDSTSHQYFSSNPIDFSTETYSIKGDSLIITDGDESDMVYTASIIKGELYLTIDFTEQILDENEMNDLGLDKETFKVERASVTAKFVRTTVADILEHFKKKEAAEAEEEAKENA